MPAEWEEHEGCIMIWPERPGSWPNGAKKARQAFREVIEAIAESETVYLVTGEKAMESARNAFENHSNVKLFLCQTDDAWARDIGPTFVRNQERKVRGVNWNFNAWGGTYNGLYATWDKDQAFAEKFASTFHYELYDAMPFVLEGGSIHSDGEGTVMVTESCLLSRGRNPELTKEQIEEKLKDYLGIEKVLWLPYGIYQDETDEHVDNVCAFVEPGKVVLAWTNREEDPQYAMSKACYEYLIHEKDAKGRDIKVVKLPIPDVPILVEPSDLEGYIFEEGEDMREAGERLAASYVNFYISNDAIIMPAFGGENQGSDERAAQILQSCFPDRRVITVMARDILSGGGNIHCITQQIPKGE